MVDSFRRGMLVGCCYQLSCRHPSPYRHSFSSMYAHVPPKPLHELHELFFQYHRVHCSLPLPREMALRRMAPCGSVHRASHGQQKACMACPSRRVQRAPGAYPTRCVGVRGRRVRALKQQRVCVRRRSVAHLGACTLDRTRLVSFFSPNYALGVRKGHPYRKDWR
jgi:hypothetical protein